MSARSIMIMAGGTGGHVFPGLAVAEILQEAHCPVVWLGTQRGLEARVVPSQGIEVHWISIAGVRGRGLIAWVLAPFKVMLAIGQALKAVWRCKPAAVLGMGGFVAGPGGIAAWLARKPLLIHEQNAVAGTTNRLLAPFAARVFETFPNSFGPRAAAEMIGNPLRRSIAELARHEPRTRPSPGGRARLLVFGGSQGALALNQCVPAALALLPEALRPEIRHQAGRTIAVAEQAYVAGGVEADVVEFIEDMSEAYEWADVAIARAGASTVFELAAAAVGAILIPLPSAIDDHQSRNAEYFAGAGAGVLLSQAQLTPARLAELMEDLLTEPEKLAQMSRSARAAARPDAARNLAQACLAYAERGQ